MPVYNTLLNTRVYNCRYCRQLYYSQKYVSDEAVKEGLNLIELEKEQVEKDPVWNVLETDDPIFVNHAGHGNVDKTTGDSETPIFWVGDCKILKDRICHFLSCLTAQELGPAIIDAGGIAYAGYKVEWTWITSDVEGDPYEDRYAEGFFRSANAFPIALIRGFTVGDARDACIDEYNRWIEIWETERADDSLAAEVIKWLIWDRDGLVVLGNMAALIRKAPPVEVTLTVESEPISVHFTLDGEDYYTPWSGTVSGGYHKVIPDKFVPIEGDRYYVFRHWENGSTRVERPLWLDEDTTIKATYEETKAHTLTVNAEPYPIEFKMDTMRYTTPYSELMEEGTYTIEVPLRYQKDGVWYGFDHWEDGSTELKRTINLTTDMTLTAYYRVLAVYTLSITAEADGMFPKIEITVDGEDYPVPFSLELPEGPHSIAALQSILRTWVDCHRAKITFRQWSDGSTEPKRKINLTSDLDLIAYYDITGGEIYLFTKDMENQKKPNATVEINGNTGTGTLGMSADFGTYTVTVQDEVDGLVVNLWNDGVTGVTSRTIDFHGFPLRRNIFAFYYPSAPRHMLSVTTNVEGIKFRIDEAYPTTPYSGSLVEHTYTIEMPAVAEVNGKWYIFKQWSDGSTERVKQVNLTSDVSLAATYEEAVPTPVVSKYMLESGADDGISWSGGFDPDKGFIYIDHRIWFRFSLKGIPKGARILSAKLIIRPHGAFDCPDRRGPLYLQHTDEDNAIPFTQQNPHDRPLSGPIVEWLLPNPFWGALDYSVDITDIIQDFVNRPGYSEGNYIAIRMDPNDNPLGAQRMISRDNEYEGECFGPRLEVIWQLPAETHILSVDAEPEIGVPVKIDGVDVGITPVQKTLTEGWHTLEVPEEVEV